MNKNKGFTLVELIAVIVILAILIGIAIPIYFNISKSVKEKNYESKKIAIETAAVSYASENNLSNNMEITVAKLVIENFIDSEGNIDVSPFFYISNPKDAVENMACRVIEINLENNEYIATMTDKINCELAQTEIDDGKIMIEAYPLDGNKVIGGNIVNSKVASWVNTDVLLALKINKEYLTEEELKNIYDSSSYIIYNMDGNTYTKGNTNNMKEIFMNNNINPDDYSNTFKVSASLILKDKEISATIKNPGNDLTTSVKINIDKEAPSITENKTNSWLNKDKGAILYGADGDGSGVKDACYVKANDYKEEKHDECLNNKNNVGNYKYTTFTTGAAPLNDMSNGLYYVWVRDNAGNVSQRSNINISNIDTYEPRVTINYDYELETDVGKIENITYDRKRKVEINARDDESGIYKIHYCFVTGENSTCTPDIELKQDSENHKYITEQFPDMKEWQRICYSVQDVAGNYGYDSKDTKYENYACSKAFHVDGVKSTVSDFSFTDKSEFKLTFKAKDDHSGVYYTKCSAKLKNGSGSIIEGKVVDNSYCIWEDAQLDFHKDYIATIDVVDYANNITPVEYEFKTDIRIGKIYSRCRPDDNGYCTEPKYLIYGNITFLLLRETEEYELAVSVKPTYSTSLVDETCCDHGNCTANVATTKNDKSGIYGNGSITGYTLKTFFKKLPSNRTYMTVSRNFAMDYITAKQFGSNKVTTPSSDSNTQVYYTFDLEPLPSVLYQTYSYNLPANNCVATNGSSSITLGTTFKGKKLSVGNWNISCSKTISGIKYNINKNVIVEKSSPDDTFVTSSPISPKTTTYTQNYKLNTTKVNSITARYGLMNYDQYAYMRNTYPYFNELDMKTLLSTYVNEVVYSETDYGDVWTKAYGHDGVDSSISALFATKNKIYAVTPLQFGRSNANMVVSYNPDGWVDNGAGSSNNPYKLSDSWEG